MNDRRAVRAALVMLLFVSAGCSSSTDTEEGDAQFTLQGRPTRPAVPSLLIASGSAPPIGTPTSFVISLTAVHLSPNADCSSPIAVSATTTGSGTLDLVTNPTMFVGTAPRGIYRCLALAISDVITFVSPVTSGPCTAGDTVQKDIYRVPENDFRDLDLNPITARGTNSTPTADAVVVLFSENPADAIARGFSPSQVSSLGKQLEVPTTATLYWDVTNTITDESGLCNLEPAVPVIS